MWKDCKNEKVYYNSSLVDEQDQLKGVTMLDFLSAIWGFLSGLPRGLFGDRVDTGWGIAFSLYTSVVAVSFLIGGYRSIHELGKAVDVRFNKDQLEQYNLARPEGTSPRVIDWAKARIQQVRSLRFTIPFGVLVLATLYWWVRESYTLKSYFILAACWLAFAFLLRPWWIATVIWTERKLIKKEPNVDPLMRSRYDLSTKSVLWAIRHYMNWGLQKSTTKRPPYIGLLRPLNPFVKLFGLRWVQLGLIRPLVICTFYACIWPVSMVIAVFYLTREFDERRYILKPSWVSGRAKEPTYESGAIPDTPGDASAATA
jgi:hypothetical protein